MASIEVSTVSTAAVPDGSVSTVGPETAISSNRATSVSDPVPAQAAISSKNPNITMRVLREVKVGDPIPQDNARDVPSIQAPQLVLVLGNVRRDLTWAIQRVVISSCKVGTHVAAGLKTMVLKDGSLDDDQVWGVAIA